MLKDAQDSLQKKVLIVEDDAGIGNLIKVILEHEPGFRALVCPTTTAALYEIEKFDPDLILMDVDLKDTAVDGIEFYGLLKTIFKKDFEDLPMIVVSAMSGPELRQRALQNGARDYLLKPFEPEELLDACRRILTKPGQVSA